jgi:hypothetical protein
LEAEVDGRFQEEIFWSTHVFLVNLVFFWNFKIICILYIFWKSIISLLLGERKVAARKNLKQRSIRLSFGFGLTRKKENPMEYENLLK